MSPTFAQLGIPFPLFEAPVAEAADYDGPAVCIHCTQPAAHCFKLGIGGDLIIPCPACRIPNTLDAADRAAVPCRACGRRVPFPPVNGPAVRLCYACLRAGHGALCKDTVLGLVAWEHTLTGVTGGVPGLDRHDVELVPLDEDWIGAKLAPAQMLELLRTPTYHSWQGERWGVCCGLPMVYVGGWVQTDFIHHAPDGDGRAFFERIVDGAFPALWDFDPEVIGIYMFRCQRCEQFAGYWDAT